MRRIALLGLLAMLPGCSSGFGDFFGDAHSFTWNPNRPIGDSENMRRVRGEAPQLSPIGPEPGNVWPGPVPPEPTLSDLEKNNQPLGSQTPGETLPAAPDHRQPRPNAAPSGNNTSGLSSPPATTTSPGSSAAGSRTPGSTSTLNGPGRNGSIVVPNGNGTSTVIGPDGSISTVPTPK